MGRTSYNVHISHTKKATYGRGEHMGEGCYIILKKEALLRYMTHLKVYMI